MITKKGRRKLAAAKKAWWKAKKEAAKRAKAEPLKSPVAQEYVDTINKPGAVYVDEIMVMKKTIEDQRKEIRRLETVHDIIQGVMYLYKSNWY